MGGSTPGARTAPRGTGARVKQAGSEPGPPPRGEHSPERRDRGGESGSGDRALQRPDAKWPDEAAWQPPKRRKPVMYHPSAYESWHSDLPEGPIDAMHMDRERSVIEAEKRDIVRR